MLLYRLLLTLAAPIILVRLWSDRIRGRATWDDLLDRLGKASRPETPGPILWLHGASVGELTAGRPLIDALLARAPQLSLVITCNTGTGRETVRNWRVDRISARLAPLDYQWSLNRFLARIDPAGLIILENEIWPNRIGRVAARQKPVAVIAARLSARSFARWSRLGGLAREVIKKIDFLSAQDHQSQDRFTSLGLPADRLGPPIVLKALVRMPASDPQDLALYAKLFPKDETILAASTHAGEEEAILEAFTAALQNRPDLRLILAPRHPQRSAEVQALIAKKGLTYRIRSQAQQPDPTTQVYLADTLGEMALWYSISGATFVGGSLVDKGGHTPYEPALFGSAILHGPHVSNFSAEYAALDGGGGAIRAGSAAELATVLSKLDIATTSALTKRATDLLGPGDMDRLDEVIDGLAALPGLTFLKRPAKGT